MANMNEFADAGRLILAGIYRAFLALSVPPDRPAGRLSLASVEVSMHYKVKINLPPVQVGQGIKDRIFNSNADGVDFPPQVLPATTNSATFEIPIVGDTIPTTPPACLVSLDNRDFSGNVSPHSEPFAFPAVDNTAPDAPGGLSLGGVDVVEDPPAPPAPPA